MNFWSQQALSGPALAVVDERGQSLSRAELGQLVTQAALALGQLGPRQLGFLPMRNNLDSLVAYLAALRVGHVPLLLPADLQPDLLAALKAQYQPDWVASAHGQGLRLDGTALRLHTHASAVHSVTARLHPDLALLLSTSGSTGSPRLVRLSQRALQANAEAIAQYLGIGPGERALTMLPPNYSYGLSVINSHLHGGGALVLRDISVLNPAFVQVLRDEAITSLCGVPYIYQMLQRTGFDRLELPALRTLTQAGGRLDERLARFFAELAARKGWRFFIMYGQTEATARISYLPPERLADKPGAIGKAIPGGQLALDPDSGELIYTGPNVMMGYAERREDLAKGDELHGVLRTGDLARQDAEGFFYLTGRLKRFVKLAGNRYSLDELETGLQAALALPVAAGGRDERLVLWLQTQVHADEAAATALIARTRHWLQQHCGLHHSLLRIRCVPQLPQLPNGKPDYQRLLEDA